VDERPRVLPAVATEGGGVLEIEMPDLPDTAMAEMTSAGPVIFYNPALYAAAGAARAFVRAHEFGHVLLHHLENEEMSTTDTGRAAAEAEADCFAAHQVPAEASRAMVKLLLRRPPEAQDAIYGVKRDRARRILVCAGLPRG
jgi:Zn-dependent peptidase ImmA (M78 family)